MADVFELPDWMGGVDPSQIGFPFTPDRSRYTKQTGLTFKTTKDGPLLLDTYCPAGEGSHPLVVMIHGGAWARGGRFEMGLTKWAGYLASGGLAVASIDYRLAPVSHYPAPFQDCLDAVDWAVEHAENLGADARRIGLWGDSAGGHLALLLALSQTRRDFAGPRMRTDPQRLKAAALLYPPTDLRRLDRGERRGGGLRGSVIDFVGVAPDENPELWTQASPIDQIHPDGPPLLILQGTRDLLVPHHHTVDFAEQLIGAGGRCELHVVDEGLHGFERLTPDDEAKRLIVRVREFLTEQLR